MNYQFINVMDEQDRFVRLKIYQTNIPGQSDSHTYSYLQARQLYQSMGDVMGLEKMVNDGRTFQDKD